MTVLQHQVAGLTVTERPGSGPMVFGLHGLSSTSAVWAPLAESLPDTRFLSVDLRGRGDSQHATGPTGLRAHARDVARILDELDLQDVVVIGHSMGAYLAPVVAQEAPDRVNQLVLVDGGIRPVLPFFMGPRMARMTFTRQLASGDKDWPTVEAYARHAKFELMVRSRPDLREKVLGILDAELGGSPGARRPRLDVARCAEDAVDTFFGADALEALEALKVPADVLLAENQRRDGQKPFISDKAVGSWLTKPGLTVQRVRGNHVTVLFAPEVLQAVCP